MIWLLIIPGIMLYIAIGFFIDRLLAKTYSEKENPNWAVVVAWPSMLPVALFYYPCYEWPRALAEYILDKKKEARK